MSIESIIGITSGIIGIVCGVYGGYVWLEKKLQKPSMSVLFDQLTDKKSSDEKRREILMKLNSYPLINNRIKEDYIQNFALENVVERLSCLTFLIATISSQLTISAKV